LALGQIRGQMILDVQQALAAYTSVRLAHLNTVTALATGGGAIMGVGTLVAGAGVAMGAGIMVAVNAAGEFERKLDYFLAVSGATQEEYDAIRVEALRLGQDTIYSADQIAESFVELGKAGVSAQDIINGIGEGVANLGAAADIPLDTAATILMSAVQTFGLGADEAVGVADRLAGAANASIIEVEDLGVSLKYAGGVAASLGIPFEDVNTALALLGTYGIRGSTAGTSLRQMLVSLSGSTKKARDTLEELGIITEDGANQFFNADGSAKSLAEIFQVLQDATAGLNEEQRLSALRSIFQNRALASAIALTTEGADGFAEMAAAIEQTTAADVASQRLDNLSGDIEILRGNIETLMITSGSTLQDFFRGLVQGATEALQWFQNLGEGTQAFILKAALVVSVLMVVVGVFGVFAGSLLNIIGLIIRLKDAAVLFSALSKAIKGAAAAQWLLNGAFLANPITWIIIGIVALIAAFILLWNNCEGFRNFFIKLWEHIKAAAAAVWEWFLNLPSWFSNLWNSISSTASSVWNSIILFFGSIPGRITAFFSTIGTFFTNLWNNIVNWAVTTWNSFLTFVAALPGRIGAFFAELPGLLGYWIGFAIGTILRLLYEAAVTIGEAVVAIVTAVITWFSELPARVGAIWQSMVDWVMNILIPWVAQVIESAGNVVTSILQWFASLPGRAATFFSNMVSRIISWLRNAWDAAKTYGQRVVDGFISFIRNLPSRVATFFTTLYNNIRNKLTDAWNKAKEMGRNIRDGIVNVINGLPGTVRGIFDRVVQAIKDKISSAFNAVHDFASGLWEGFKDGLGIASPSYIEHAMWAITDVLDTETDRMAGMVRRIQGLGNNISEVGNHLGEGFGSSLNEGLRTMRSSLHEARTMSDQLVALNAANQLSGDITATQSGGTLGVLSTGSGVTNNYYDMGDVMIPVEDLEEVKTVKDVFDTVQRSARQRGGN